MLIMDTASGFVVRDLNSTNVTFVDRVSLSNGDHPSRAGTWSASVAARSPCCASRIHP